MMLKTPVHRAELSKTTTTGAAIIVDKRPMPAATPNPMERAIKTASELLTQATAL